MKVRIRLLDRTTSAGNAPFPCVKLRIRDRYGTFAEVPFMIDTAADVTTIPVRLAHLEGLPFGETRRGTAGGIAGIVAVFHDQVRVLIAGKEHIWPCDFTEAPAPQQPGQRSPEFFPVLGRAGFLDQYAVAIDSGFLILTRLGIWRRALRRCLHILWDRIGLVYPADRPL